MIGITNKNVELKKKRLPKGQRIHLRRVKQATRKEGNTYTLPKVRRTPVKVAVE